MRKKIVIIAIACVVLVASAGGVLYLLRTGPRSPEQIAEQISEQTPEQIVAYLASEEFEKLDPDQKRLYFNKAREKLAEEDPSGGGMRRMFRSRDQLSDDQRQRLRENVSPMFRGMMEERIDKYFELSPEDRVAYLDEMIDRMVEMRGRRTESRQEGRQPTTRRGRRGSGFTPARMKQMIENTPPEKRAKFVEFMKAFRKRMEERGVDFRRRRR